MRDLVESFAAAVGTAAGKLAAGKSVAAAVTAAVTAAAALADALHFQLRLHKNRKTYLPHQSYFSNLYKILKPSITHSTISFIE